MAFALKSTLEKDEGFDVRIWRLGDGEDYEEGLAAPGGYFREAGEVELAGKLAFAVNDATPSVALDGKLIRVLDCPTVEELVLNAEGSVTDSQEDGRWK
jgi:hypothetical protein